MILGIQFVNYYWIDCLNDALEIKQQLNYRFRRRLLIRFICSTINGFDTIVDRWLDMHIYTRLILILRVTLILRLQN